MTEGSNRGGQNNTDQFSRNLPVSPAPSVMAMTLQKEPLFEVLEDAEDFPSLPNHRSRPAITNEEYKLSSENGS